MFVACWGEGGAWRAFLSSLCVDVLKMGTKPTRPPVFLWTGLDCGHLMNKLYFIFRNPTGLKQLCATVYRSPNLRFQPTYFGKWESDVIVTRELNSSHRPKNSSGETIPQNLSLCRIPFVSISCACAISYRLNREE